MGRAETHAQRPGPTIRGAVDLDWREEVGVGRGEKKENVLQRVVTALREPWRWTEVVAEQPLPPGTQATVVRPDLCATRWSTGAPLWADGSVVVATAAAHMPHTAGSPRVPGAAPVREAQRVGTY